jgi:hypothetical protein
MAVSEAVEELGGTILEFYEMEEGFKEFPKEKVSRQLSKAKKDLDKSKSDGDGDGEVRHARRAAQMTAIKNYRTGMRSVRSAAQTADKIRKVRGKAIKNYEKAAKKYSKAVDKSQHARRASDADPNDDFKRITADRKDHKKKKALSKVERAADRSGRIKGIAATSYKGFYKGQDNVRQGKKDIQKQVSANWRDANRKKKIAKAFNAPSNNKSTQSARDHLERSFKKEETVVEALGGTILEFYELNEEKKPYPFNKVSRKASYRELEDDNLTKIRRHASHASMNALKGKGGDESAQNKMSDRIKKLRGEQGKAMKQLKQDKADGFTGAPSRKKLANLEKRRLAIKTASNQLKHQKEDVNLDERTLDKTEKKEKERIVKGMKKSMPELKKRYGDDAKSVMYATATKRAKERLDTSKSDYRYGVEESRDPAKEEQGKKIASYEKSGRAFGLIKKFRQENPGSRQPKKVRGAKETEGQAAARRRGAQAQRAAKYGLTSKEKKETQARAPYYSTRD